MSFRGLTAIWACIAFGYLTGLPVWADAPPKKRSFQFMYASTVTGLKPGQKARIWLPLPQSSADQEVAIVSKDVPPATRLENEATYGNQVFFVEATADDNGKIPFKIDYKVTRREVKGDDSAEMEEKADLLRRYLQADVMVPLEGKA